MKNKMILTSVAAAMSMAFGLAYADETSTVADAASGVQNAVQNAVQNGAAPEQCKVVDKDGKGLIKAQMADCKAATHSCAGQNTAGDPQSWINVPAGQCAKINQGDFSGVPQTVKDKVEAAE